MQNSTNFINAFDEFKERKRQLFNIPEIDGHLFFEDKKNICIVNNSASNISDNFLYSIITNACIGYQLNGDEITYDKNIPAKKMTLLVDAGNGNNLGHIYLNLIKKSSYEDFDIKEILKQIVVLRAFTFYQMLNIIIKEIPKFICQYDSNCKIQIIILDFLDTLIESSNCSIASKDKNSHFRSERDFKNNEKLVIEAMETLLNLSNNHFVILTCYKSINIVDRSFFYKFSNCLEMDVVKYVDKSKKSMGDLDKVKAIRKEILLKIKSKKTISSTTINQPIICNTKKGSLSSINELFTSSLNEQDLMNSCVL